MSRLARRAAAVLAVLACALPGGAQAGVGDNVATAINEQDDTQVFDFAWDIDRQRDPDVVDDLNSATARAHCARCGATAIAFQVVLVSGSPRVVVPQNTAEAVNVECTDCAAIAEARQFVRVLPQPVRFTGTGRSTLADVQERLAALETQSLPPADLHLAVEAQEARVRDVLDHELVLKSNPDKEPRVVAKRVLQSTELR